MAGTIRDVARAAGVSISTASRSPSSPDGVADETRLRVQGPYVRWVNTPPHPLTASVPAVTL